MDPLTSDQGTATTPASQEDIGVSSNRSKEMNIVLGVLAKMAIRWWNKQKLFEMKDFLRGVSIDVIYEYFVKDMLGGFEFGIDAIFMDRLKSLVVKSGLEWSADSFLKLGKPKQFMDYVKEQAMLEGVLLVYEFTKANIVPSDSGISRAFI